VVMSAAAMREGIISRRFVTLTMRRRFRPAASDTSPGARPRPSLRLPPKWRQAIRELLDEFSMSSLIRVIDIDYD
jgi:hypothetical protein